MDAFSRILLIKPSALEGVIRTLPVLDKLRKRFPGAEIDWLIAPANADLVRSHPAVPGLILSPRWRLNRFGRDLRATAAYVRSLRRLRRGRYDLVIDLHGRFQSAMFAVATGAPVRIGFPPPPAGNGGGTGAWENPWIAYTDHLPFSAADASPDGCLEWLGKRLGFDAAPPDTSVHLPEAVRQRVRSILRRHGLRRYAALAPKAAPGPIQTQAERLAWMARAGRKLIRRGRGVVVVGRDGGACEAVLSACPGALDFSGKITAGELGALLSNATLCVTDDPGTARYAAVLGRPVANLEPSPASSSRTFA